MNVGNLRDVLVKAVLFPLQEAQMRTVGLWLLAHLQVQLLAAAARFVPVSNTAHFAWEMADGEKE